MDTASMATMDMPKMSGDMPHSKDHGALEKLINSANPTHVAVKSGAWSDPGTWKDGKVPGNGASVFIDEGMTVTYDQVSDERLKTVANRGNLKFATGKDTQLIVETILNAEEGRVDIGSEAQAVAAENTAKIIFTSDRGVDTQWDPTQMSKGFVSHGTVNIYGAQKQNRVSLVGDAAAGDDTLTFKEPLSGWQVGDQIVLAGTGYGYGQDDKTNSRFQDEVLTITEINGSQVKFVNKDITEGDNTVLRFDHERHSKLDPNEIDLYAANLTRNVSFETENGKDVPIGNRAHVMLMHNPDVNILNAGFYDLGRSDKNKIVDDIGENVDGSNGNGTNIRGRYSVHLHQTGLDPDAPAILRGNAISGSPGWGLVQHESHAGLEDNIVFDTVGAGIVAESGNEIGWWTNNTSIKSTGMRWDIASGQFENREKKFDLGFEGDGYWIQGAAQIKNTDNVAISTNHTGMSLFGGSLELEDFRPVKTIAIDTLSPEKQKLFAEGQKEADIRFVPMETVKGFEGYNNTHGLEVWGHNTNFDGTLGFSENAQEVDVRTAHLGRASIEDFKLWNNLWNGTSIQYSSNIDLKNGMAVGIDEDDRRSGGRGVFVNHATYNSTVDNVTVDGFEQGAHFEKLNSDENFNTNTLKNSTIRNNTYNLSKVADETLDNNRADDFGEFVKVNNNRFEEKEGNRAPVARFSSKGVGGLGVRLDAGASSDADPYITEDGTAAPVDSKGVAAYGWDVDSDGAIDYFGRSLNHVFDSAGTKKVSLTVLDAQGAATTLQQDVNVQPTDYGNAFMGGNFEGDVPVQEEPWMNNSQWTDKGWFITETGSIGNGVAKLSKEGTWGNHIGQVVRNEKMHRGQQKLNFKLQNLEGSDEAATWRNNKIEVKLWGVNGQFENNGWEPTGPEKVGTLPMERTEIVSQSYGGEDGEFFDWKTMSLDADLGEGFEYLLFQVNTTYGDDAGDSIAIDDVSLSGKADATTVQPNPTPNPGTDPELPPTTTDPVTPPKPIAGPEVDFSPVIKLSFDEETGQVAANGVPGSRKGNARLSDGITRSEGIAGNAISLNGSDDIATLKSSKDLNIGIQDERTLSMWFKTSDVESADKQVIYEEGGVLRGLGMYVEDGLVHFGGWNRNESDWQGSWTKSDKGQVTADKWHHVALVLDGTDTVQDNALTAYLDGEVVGTMSGSQLWSHNNGVGIGNVNGATRFAQGKTTLNNGFGLSGAVDELSVYNDALSGSQIEQLATAFG